MTTFVRTWTASLNNVPSQATLDAQGKAVLYAFKENYKSAGWTCEGSSSSTAAGMDGTDRWASAANLVWAAAGVAHSWIVLRSPSGYLPSSKFVYVMLSCGTAATSQHLANISWASAAFTSGSTTADPTAPANVRAFASKQFLSATLSNSKWHCLRNTTGDVLNFSSKDNDGFPSHVNGSMQSTPNAESGDNYPWLGMAGWSASTPGGFALANTQSSTHGISFWTDGTVLASNTAGVARYVEQNLNTDIMGLFTNSGSAISGQYPDMPAYLFSGVTSKVAWRGALVDLRLAPTGTGVVVGTVEPPAPASSTSAIFGEFWVFNGGVTPQF